MIRRITILLALCISTTAWSQISHQFTQYTFNPLPINPAAAGKDLALDATFIYRAQWVGVEGFPSTQSLAVHSPLNIANSSAGLYLVSERLGAEQSTYFMLAYAYRRSYKFGKLSAGLSGGAIQKTLDGSALRAPGGDYSGLIEHYDKLIPTTKQSGWAFEMNAGLFFNNSNLSIGLSALNLLGSKIKLSTLASATEIQFGRTFNAFGSYKFELNRKYTIEPSLLFKTDMRRFQTDFSIIVDYKHNMWGGITFRGNSRETKDAIAIVLGVNVKKIIRIGYSYDFTLSELSNVSSGSHEVGLNYKLNIKELVKPGKIIYNPRYL